MDQETKAYIDAKFAELAELVKATSPFSTGGGADAVHNRNAMVRLQGRSVAADLRAKAQAAPRRGRGCNSK